ncbi:MAG: NHLP family bacteriocin export ABC transporter peptidase/permease/ATPase subunit [Verrucomicrobia bacterium]|nr:NHLP family bacteriocin export ABC transporter peptidase/permease/ATPase subunit [Verrucomicrobiota bacterium]
MSSPAVSPEVVLPGRVPTPTLLQMEAVECGAAALGIILRHNNLWLPLEQLRLECGVGRDGSKASNLLKAARRFGMEGKGIRCELDALLRQKPPVILYWNFNHFLVYEGVSEGMVHLNDPATGPRRVTVEELEASFTGVVLVVEPGPNFTPGGEKPSLAAALRRRVSGFEIGLSFALLTGLLVILPNIVNPAFTRIFIDEYLVGDKTDILRPLLSTMAVSILFMILLVALQRHFLLRLETKLALTTSAKFFTHVIQLPMEFFSQRYAGEIGSRVLINDKVAKVLSDKMVTTALDMMSLIFFAAVMIQYDLWLTLACVFFALFNVIGMKIVQRPRVDASFRVLQERGKMMGTSMNGVQMIETLKATGGENEFFARWGGYQAKTISAEQEMDFYGQTLSAVPPFTKALISATILGLGGWRVMDGHLTIGLLVAFQSLMDGFTKPITSFVTFGNALQETGSDLNRLDDVLRYEIDPAYRQTESDPRFNSTIKLSGLLEVRNLTFGFNPLAPPLIENLSFSIRPGQRVALVGGSGSGKSTVSKIVAGLFRPWSGEILLDGVSRDNIPRRLLHNSVAMVDQDIFMFEGTVRDNLTMWDSGIPDSHITQACKDAAIADIIASRQGGLSSTVAEGGANFSGGQRQRLEIARSLVNSPSLLILDEATSALDPSTEEQIDQNLRRRGCSCLIVAHRLSTIRDCDEIIVLEYGKVVERGSHESMKNAGGPYAKLISH